MGSVTSSDAGVFDPDLFGTAEPVAARYQHERGLIFRLTADMGSPGMTERLQRIREQVYFAGEMPADAVVAALLAVGFVDPVIDRQLLDIHWAQARKMPLWRALERLTQDRFAICVRKPE
jgi:hypothetical protein